MTWFCKHAWEVKVKTFAPPLDHALGPIEGEGAFAFAERCAVGSTTVLMACAKCGKTERHGDGWEGSGVAMTCPACPLAYESGKATGKKDGHIEVLEDLAKYGTACAARAESLLGDGKREESLRMLGAADAVSKFAQDFILRIKAGHR